MARHDLVCTQKGLHMPMNSELGEQLLTSHWLLHVPNCTGMSFFLLLASQHT